MRSKVAELTAKQAEALALAASHHTSKEIARKLDISPRTVEQRLDAARKKLGVETRAEAARLYTEHRDPPYTTPCEATHIASPGASTAHLDPQGDMLSFKDAYAFDETASWSRRDELPRPVWQAKHLGVGARVLSILAIAIALVVIVLAVLGVANALSDLI